ncbi:MAG: response regulator transcription factor [Akkermansiaceae bacterium]|nr:response regulator transcription factor [Akkermansiaceae bacterium]
MRLLVAEDSVPIQKAIVIALQETGYAVDAAANGEDALWMILNHPYDAVVLDVMMPGLDGFSVLKKLREEGNETKILFLTAKDRVEDKVHGLRQGADDYLVKPFDLEELLARVAVLCRRKYGKTQSSITIEDLEIDTVAKRVQRGGRLIDLRAREYNLLEYLAMRKGELVSRSEIEEHIYDDLVSPMSNVVDAAIYVLRKALGEPALIQTKRGQGYVMESKI